jgi:hypothetical protein
MNTFTVKDNLKREKRWQDIPVGQYFIGNIGCFPGKKDSLGNLF